MIDLCLSLILNWTTVTRSAYNTAVFRMCTVYYSKLNAPAPFLSLNALSAHTGINDPIQLHFLFLALLTFSVRNNTVTAELRVSDSHVYNRTPVDC